MFGQRDWPWRRRLAGLLAVLVGVSLLVVLPASPAQAQTTRPLLLIGGTFATAEGLDAVAKDYFVSQEEYDERNVYTLGLEIEEGWNLAAELWVDFFATLIGMPVAHASGDGTASIDRDFRDTSSVEKISKKVDAILAEHPGADKVDIIGHSQGAVAARWYVKDPEERGEDKVHTLVSLGGPQRGVVLSGPVEHAVWRYACDRAATPGRLDVCDDMLIEDDKPIPEFITKLNAGDPTPGDINYYHLYVRADGLDDFENLGFESELVTIPVPGGGEHAKEWEYPEMQREMLERLRQP